MDENDPAYRLAHATHRMLNGVPNALDTALTDLRPSSKDIARAYALCLTHAPFGAEASRLILHTRLEVALMQEHVAAQKKMGSTVNRLTVVLVVLTLALVLFGGIDLWQKAHSPGEGGKGSALVEFSNL